PRPNRPSRPTTRSRTPAPEATTPPRPAPCAARAAPGSRRSDRLSPACPPTSTRPACTRRSARATRAPAPPSVRGFGIGRRVGERVEPCGQVEIGRNPFRGPHLHRLRQHRPHRLVGEFALLLPHRRWGRPGGGLLLRTPPTRGRGRGGSSPLL